MDLEHWYRCNVCGHMYTPQQIHALIHLMVSRAGEGPVEGRGSAAVAEPPGPIPCRIRGCKGTLHPSDSKYRGLR
jgi:hypothetical protein